MTKISCSQDYRIPKGETPIYRDGYVLHFNEQKKVSDWVGYVVKGTDVKGSQTPEITFFKDPYIGSCPMDSDYENYGYSKAVLKPYVAARNSEKEMLALNNFLNVVPMDATLDKGVWRILENMEAGWSVMFDSVFVITGPIYKKERPIVIGDNKIHVPDQFFKVIMVYNGMDMGAIGFVIPNNEEANDVKKYSMPIDSVELLTGYDFFSELPDYLEFYMEEKIDAGVWKDQSMSYQLKAAYIQEDICVAQLPSGERCSIKTSCITQHCWKHGCDVKQE